jgi:hypothetical protein
MPPPPETFSTRAAAVRSLIVDGLLVAGAIALGLSHVLSPVETVSVLMIFLRRPLVEPQKGAA